MDFVDKELKCIDCGSEFVFTAGEQFFFHTKQFQNIPKHCKKCKAKRNLRSHRPVKSVRSETSGLSQRFRYYGCGVKGLSTSTGWDVRWLNKH
jgi:hypothetical protein